MDDMQERLAQFLYEREPLAESGWGDWEAMSDDGSAVYGHEPGKNYYREEAAAILAFISAIRAEAD